MIFIILKACDILTEHVFTLFFFKMYARIICFIDIILIDNVMTCLDANRIPILFAIVFGFCK
jgi:hypothetical protein